MSIAHRQRLADTINVIGRRKLIYLLYRTLQAAALPFFLLYVAWRGVRNRRYLKRVGERFGFLPRSLRTTGSSSIWLHAVSVGEVLSAAGLVRELKAQIAGARVYVSCTTLAGRDLADQRLGGVADAIFYAPFDFAWAVRRVLRRVRPRLVIILETEIWPNLWNETKRSGASLLVVNARISDRAYPRYREFAWFFRPVLSLADRILVQSDNDADRYRWLGVEPAVSGNLKYDFDPRSVSIAPELKSWCEQAERLWVAASTMPPAQPDDPDEDDVVLDVWERVRRPGLRMLLAPRRPERFQPAAEKLASRGIAFARRSALHDRATEDVLLLDSIGELAGVFRYATAVLMGGTLASRGGHNILEPAAFGKPVIVGPHMENFRAIASKFAGNSALIEIAGEQQLAGAVEMALNGEADGIGERARALAESECGATERAAAAAGELFAAARLQPIPHGPAYPFLWLGSLAWRAGMWVDRTLTRPRRLRTPVISVGGLAMGGSGKTPLVRWLARKLHECGYEVAILTRGYKRAREGDVIVARGGTAPMEETGDEVQLYLRDGTAHVGVGADRYRTACRIEAELSPDVFLLDDGFQHWRLARDLDVVVHDGIGRVFPIGRDREPESALERADVVVRKKLVTTGFQPPLPAGARLGAFCGIGDPDSFRSTIEQQSIELHGWWTYPDHHYYSNAEIASMLRDVDVLVTTEKDWVKVPPGHPVHFLTVDFAPEKAKQLLEIVQSRIG